MDRFGKVIGHELKTEVEKVEGESVTRTFMAVKVELQPHGMADTNKPSKAILHLPHESAVKDFPIGAVVNFSVWIVQTALELEDAEAVAAGSS